MLLEMLWSVGTYDYQTSVLIPIRRQALPGRGLRIRRPIAENDSNLESIRMGLDSGGGLTFEPGTAFYTGASVKLYGVS